jgi:hypothetical protein
MSEFLTEFVGVPEDRCLMMSSPKRVREILEGLWVICSAESSGAGSECDCSPKGEFRFRGRCKSKDRIFRIKDFEGGRARTGERAERDGGPGRGGIDLLGKYSLSDSTVTVYVDSCRKVVGRKYGGVDYLEELIEVVLIHELAHLITDRVYKLEYNDENDSVHLWEYTAQCATYAYVSTRREKDLEMFQQLSSHQPFIYRTWEGLKAVERFHAKRIVKVVQSIFSALKEPPPPEIEDTHFTSGFEE